MPTDTTRDDANTTYDTTLPVCPLRKPGVIVLVALVLTLLPLRISAADASVRQLPANATIKFASTSTLHDFGGSLPSQPFTLIISNGTWSASADVLSGLMNTAHEKRDRKMHEMFATNSFPKMHGKVNAAPIPGATGTNAALRLTIRDKTNDLVVRITGWTENAGAIKFHATWELSLKDYALKPPSVLGVIKVGDRIQLEADVIAAKTISAPVAPPSKP